MLTLNKYQTIKNLGINNALDNFKTFEYLRDSCYTEFLNEIESLGNYDACIIGHSLGVTDKTILEEILVKNKCQRINLFKRSDYKNSPEKFSYNYKVLTYAAARIIEDEKILRRKVVDQENAMLFP